MLDMEGWEIAPGFVLLGQRIEIGAHSDKYEVYQHPGGIAPFLHARVFDLAPDPIKVRKHRLRCIKRLEPRTVLKDTRGNIRVVVFMKDFAAEEDGQIPRDVQDWLESFKSHVHARADEILLKQGQADTVSIAASIDRGLGWQETHRAFIDGPLLIFKILLSQIISGISFLVWPMSIIGIAYLAILSIRAAGWLLFSLWY